MYCGNCLRDNALVAAYRRRGHTVRMVPLYLPVKLDEADHSGGTPIFFSGVNVYLDQKAPLYRSAPEWLRRRLASPALLRWVGRFAARTRPEQVADLTLSMLRGESGNQSRDLAELIDWLRTQPRPEIVCLSNALLSGMVGRLKAALRVPVVCLLAGEDTFLDAMAEPLRSQVWRTLAERLRWVDGFVAPSRYFAERMIERLALAPEKVRVVPSGINLAGYPRPLEAPPSADFAPASRQREPSPPVLGYFARLCHDKGLDTLIEAFILIRQRGRVKDLKLKIGGGCGPGDQRFVQEQRDRLAAAGLLGDAEFHANVDHAAKIAFLQSLTVFSVPALYGEAFGLYLIEALAAGTPVVQPRHAAFPELVESTGGGVLCAPGDARALAEAIENLLLDPDRRRACALTGQHAVHAHHSIEHAADELLKFFQQLATSTRIAATLNPQLA